MKKRFTGSPQRAGTGVRGGVEYRQMSEQYVSQRNYPTALFVAVNTVLVLLSLAIVFAVVVAFTPLADFFSFGSKPAEVTFTLEFYDPSGALSSPAVVGTSLLDAENGTVLGEITAVSAKPLEKSAVLWQEEWESLPSGATPEVLSYPVHIVRVTVRVTAEHRAGEGYRLPNGAALRVGEKYAVSLGASLAVGECVTLVSEEVSS